MGLWPFIGRDAELRAFCDALADKECQGFIIHGDTGTGKSRLASECLKLARKNGHRGGRAAAHATAGAPLASLAHLLPVGIDKNDPACIFRQVNESLRAARTNSTQGQAKKFVLLVDDLELIDSASATLIVQLLDSGSVLLVATMRYGSQLPQVTAVLEKGDHMRHVEIADLSEEETEELLVSVLRGPVEPNSVSLLYSASAGNPLYLRELTIGALSSNCLVSDDEIWLVVGSLSGTSRLVEHVSSRLDGISEAAMKVLETVAICGPVEARDMPANAVDELARARLVQEFTAGRRDIMEMAHPLYGDIVRSLLSAARRRVIWIEQIKRLHSHGARRREDASRIASWELAAWGRAEPDTLLQGAKVSQESCDFELARKLALAASQVTESLFPRLLLARALQELGEIHQAEKVLSEIEALAESDDDRIAVSVQQASMGDSGIVSLTEGLRKNTKVASEVHTADARSSMQILRGSTMVSFNCFHQALPLLVDVASMSHDETRLIGQRAQCIALVATGQVEQGLNLSRICHFNRLQLNDSVTLPHPVQFLIPVIFSLEESGRLQEAYGLGTQGWEVAIKHQMPDAQMWLSGELARCSLLQGRPLTARRWAAQAAALARRHSQPAPLRFALSRLVEAAVLLGDPTGAHRAISEARSLVEFGMPSPENAVSEGWFAASQGDLSAGRGLLAEAAAAARDAEHFTSEAYLLTEIARLGGAVSVVARLTEITGFCDGALARARAQYVRALVRGDADQLLECATTLENTGALLVAAEAAVAAASAWQRGGFSREATAANNKAASLTSLCEGAQTPSLLARQAATPLTGREMEVALLSAKGLSSAEMADRMMISRRTVDNHLQNIYRKLGVTSRRSLREWLAEA
ncbi:LuxR C-terminal-related transcriptional regulator [Streptomyces sp. NPDC019396]|uniref:helix-turn-helix transcriptional regulator n=1 Tax=Streptomyces sp. NPDC019396 TaxID=3154687 RepID=UPI0033C8581C